MSNLRELFTKTPPHRAVIGICELVVTSRTWICRIGGKQWDGDAADFTQARIRAAQCMRDNIAPIALIVAAVAVEL